MAEKEVKIIVITETDDKDVEDLESVIEAIRSKKLQLEIEANAQELDEVNSQIEDTKSQLTDLKAKVEVDNSEIESLEAELEDLESQRLELDIETDTSELEELDSQIGDIQSSLSDLQASVEVDNSEIESLQAELDELEARQIELKGNVEISGLEESSQGFQDLEQQVDTTSSALESMAMLDIAGALSQWGAEAESFAQELDNIAISTEQLAIQTGMTDAEMTGMLNTITNATFPREEALMYVKSLDQIGVSTQNLGASATGLDRINDAFHLGAEKTNRLGQELSVLGVDMNNVSSSFNALAYANANTVGGMDNYFSFLQRYDAQFKELGMSVDQASVAIAAATQKYGGGRAALSGMSEALKNCNGDMSALERELGLTAGSLTNATQLTGKYAGQLDKMANAEGKHKTLTQQIGAALDDVTASLDGVMAPFSSFIGMIGNAGSFAVGINGIIQLTQAIRKAEIAQAALNLVMSMNPIFLVVIAIVALIAALWYLYNTNEDVRKAIDAFGQALWNIGQSVYNAIIGPVEDVISTLQWLYDMLSRVTSGDWTVKFEIQQVGGDVASDTVTNLANNDISRGLVEALMGPEAMAQVDANMPQFQEELAGKFSDAIGGMWSLMTGDTEGFLNWIGGLVSTPMDNVLAPVHDGFNQIPVWVSNAWSNAVNGTIVWLSTMLSTVVNKFNEIKTWITTKLNEIVSFIRTGAQKMYDTFIGPIVRIKDKVAGELAAIKSTVMSYIQPLIDAFNTLGSAASWAFSVLGLGQRSPGKMYKAVKNELGWTTSLVENDSSLAKASANLGSDFSKSFNPVLGYNVDGNFTGNTSVSELVRLLNEVLNALKDYKSTGNISNTFIINGDMDNEDRMQKFIDEIVRRMSWDNNTAGRTIDTGGFV